MLDPVAVALKFGFLAVLYLFLVWMARSALRDLRGTAGPVAAGVRRGRPPAAAAPPAPYDDATGLHTAGSGLGNPEPLPPPRLRVRTAPGLRAGAAYDLSGGAVLGRGDGADIRLQDTFASSEHVRLEPQGDVVVIEDLGSTNGTFLNGEPLRGPQPLHVGDEIRIGDSEFAFER